MPFVPVSSGNGGGGGLSGNRGILTSSMGARRASRTGSFSLGDGLQGVPLELASATTALGSKLLVSGRLARSGTIVALSGDDLIDQILDEELNLRHFGTTRWCEPPSALPAPPPDSSLPATDARAGGGTASRIGGGGSGAGGARGDGPPHSTAGSGRGGVSGVAAAVSGGSGGASGAAGGGGGDESCGDTRGDAVTGAQSELEVLLGLDLQGLRQVESSLSRAQLLTDSMVKILGSFEGRLDQLESDILPVHRHTNKLKGMHENIETTLSGTEKILEMFDTENQVKDIRDRCNEMENAALLEQLDQIGAALTFFESHRDFKSAERSLRELKAISLKGLKELERRFKDDLSRFAIDVDPHRIDASEPVLMAPAKVQELKMWMIRLDAFKQMTYLEDYSERRSKFLLHTLRKLQPDKIPQALEAGDGTTSSGYTKGSHPFIPFLEKFGVLLTAERNLVLSLIDAPQCDFTFAETCEAAVDLLNEIGENIVKVQRSASNKWFGVFALFDVWENLRRQMKKYQEIFKISKVSHVSTAKEIQLTKELLDYVGKLTAAIQKAFADFEADVRTKIKQLPLDGTVHSLASNICSYFKRLFEFEKTVEVLLPPIPSVKVNKMANWILARLEDLRENLESRAREEKKQTLATIFLLNNYHYIAKTVKNSDLLAVINTANSTFVQDYDALINGKLLWYRESWQKAIKLLDQSDLPPVPYNPKDSANVKLNQKERKIIKARFSGFNAEIEEQYNTQKFYFIFDEELRRQIRTDTSVLIVPTYQDFYRRYSGVPFTQTPGKYVRYTPDTLKEMLNHFFEGEETTGAGRGHRFTFSLPTPSLHF